MDQDIIAHPVIYQLSHYHRILPALKIAPLAILSLAGHAHLGLASPRWLWVFVGVCFAIVIVTSLNMSCCKIVLYSDRIVKRTWFGTKTMKRDDVAEVRNQKGDSLMLVYKNNSTDGITIPKGIGGDAAWKAWMQDLAGAETSSP